MEEGEKYYQSYESFGNGDFCGDGRAFNPDEMYDTSYFKDYIKHENKKEDLFSRERLIGAFALHQLMDQLYSEETPHDHNFIRIKRDTEYEDFLKKTEQRLFREEQARQEAERLAEENRRREAEARREQERQNEERRRQAEAAQQGKRAFIPLHEARIAEMAALFPELGDKNLRNLFGTVIDSRATGTTDGKIFRTLAKKYHPDTAPEERRDTYGRVMGALSNLYDSKTKSFKLA